VNCEDVRKELHRVMVKMADYQWKSAQEVVTALYARLNETPADIHNNYNWYVEERLK
jgi:hypothetical protein